MIDCHIEGLSISSFHTLRITVKSAGTNVITMAETIIGNVNHLSKPAS
jgi:hypothetical protein